MNNQKNKDSRLCKKLAAVCLALVLIPATVLPAVTLAQDAAPTDTAADGAGPMVIAPAPGAENVPTPTDITPAGEGNGTDPQDEKIGGAEGVFAEAGMLTFEQANEKALEAHPGATIICVEIDTEDDFIVYEVSFWTEDKQFQTILINAIDGTTVLADTAALAEKATITQQQAIDAALALHADGIIVQTGLDEEDGMVVYEVELQTPAGEYFEIVVDAASGEVVTSESDAFDGEENTEEGQG